MSRHGCLTYYSEVVGFNPAYQQISQLEEEIAGLCIGYIKNGASFYDCIERTARARARELFQLRKEYLGKKVRFRERVAQVINLYPAVDSALRAIYEQAYNSKLHQSEHMPYWSSQNDIITLYYEPLYKLRLRPVNGGHDFTISLAQLMEGLERIA